MTFEHAGSPHVVNDFILIKTHQFFLYDFRTEYSTVIVNKTVTRLCSSVVCCPGFSLSNGTCETGNV